MSRWFALALLPLGTSCVKQGEFPGATGQDRATCRIEARLAALENDEDTGLVPAFAGLSIRQRTYNSCMRGLGYEEEAESEPAATASSSP